MTSLGDDTFCGTLTADTINYTTLNPALTGFVHNPLNSDLDCNNKKLTNANEITTGTLNYTTLNPPIPTGFVNNPMSVSLDGNNLNITNVNAIESATVKTTGQITSDLEIISAGKLEGANGLVSGHWEIGGNLTVDAPGLARFKGGMLLDAVGFSTFNNRCVFNQPPSYSPSIYGGLGGATPPIILTAISPPALITSFTMNPSTTSVVVFGHPPSAVPTYSTMEIITPFTDVLIHYDISITQQSIGVSSGDAIPNVSVNVSNSDKSPTNDKAFQFVMEHGSYTFSSQVVKYVIKLTYSVP